MKHDNRIANKLNDAVRWIVIPLMAVLGVYILFIFNLPLCLSIERKTTSTYSQSINEAKSKGTYISSYSETDREFCMQDSTFIPDIPEINELFLERKHWYTSSYGWFGHYTLSDSIYYFKFVFNNNYNPSKDYKLWFDGFDYRQINSYKLSPSELPEILLLHIASSDSNHVCNGTIILKRND